MPHVATPARRLAALSVAATLLVLAAMPVSSRAQALPPPTTGLDYARETSWNVDGQPEIGAMAPTIRAVLDAVRVQYAGIDGTPVEGFFPGPNYSYAHIPGWTPFRLYGRDTATILPMARYFYGADALRSSVEEFLRQQYPDGGISATIAPDFETDKATVVSDEETSVILAAVEAFRAAPSASWLERPLRGQSVLQRLNRSMAWVLAFRWDPTTRLVKRAHTTDWGDVKWEEAASPTDMQPGDQWTVSIYDQAIAYAALRGLAELNRAGGQPLEAQRWDQEAIDLRGATNATLWENAAERGYYRIHRHLEPDQVVHPMDEGAIVAIGNAAALYYGLADDEQAVRIAAALERARVAAGSPKPGLTLDPPYTGWRESQMDPRVYQNGAIWDWWGGRQVSGEFRYGQRRLATQHLLAIARDWAQHPGEVREWESPWLDRVGRDRGYAGAASVVGESIISGLFGVSLVGNELTLAPRLGEWDGQVRVYQPASDLYVAYRYDWTASRVTIEYGTNVPTGVSVRLPLLWSGEATAWLDGRDQLTPTVAWQGTDRVASVVVPGGVHRVELRRVPPATQRAE